MTFLRLLRHTEIEQQWMTRCYGQSEVGLSGAGKRAAADLVEELGEIPWKQVVSSPLGRALAIAAPLAVGLGLSAQVDSRLSERHFGRWEGLEWDAIYATSGNAMDGLIDNPSGFAPPGGETTFQLRDRVIAWHRGLVGPGPILAVSHGGPIAALIGTLSNEPTAAWLSRVPPFGGWVDLP